MAKKNLNVCGRLKLAVSQVVGTPGPGVEHVSGRALLGNTAVNFWTATSVSLLGACIVYYGKSDYPYKQI